MTITATSTRFTLATAGYVSDSQSRQNISTPLASIALAAAPTVAEIQALVDNNGWTDEIILLTDPDNGVHRFMVHDESGSPVVRFAGMVPRIQELTTPPPPANYRASSSVTAFDGSRIVTIDPATGLYEHWILNIAGTWEPSPRQAVYQGGGVGGSVVDFKTDTYTTTLNQQSYPLTAAVNDTDAIDFRISGAPELIMGTDWNYDSTANAVVLTAANAANVLVGRNAIATYY